MRIYLTQTGWNFRKFTIFSPFSRFFHSSQVKGKRRRVVKKLYRATEADGAVGKSGGQSTAALVGLEPRVAHRSMDYGIAVGMHQSCPVKKPQGCQCCVVGCVLRQIVYVSLPHHFCSPLSLCRWPLAVHSAHIYSWSTNDLSRPWWAKS